MDERLRDLERQAAGGDLAAAAELSRLRARAAEEPLPIALTAVADAIGAAWETCAGAPPAAEALRARLAPHVASLSAPTLQQLGAGLAAVPRLRLACLIETLSLEAIRALRAALPDPEREVRALVEALQECVERTASVGKRKLGRRPGREHLAREWIAALGGELAGESAEQSARQLERLRAHEGRGDAAGVPCPRCASTFTAGWRPVYSDSDAECLECGEEWTLDVRGY